MSQSCDAKLRTQEVAAAFAGRVPTANACESAALRAPTCAPAEVDRSVLRSAVGCDRPRSVVDMRCPTFPLFPSNHDGRSPTTRGDCEARYAEVQAWEGWPDSPWPRLRPVVDAVATEDLTPGPPGSSRPSTRTRTRRFARPEDLTPGPSPQAERGVCAE